MSVFCVVYHRGSFALADRCETREQAFLRALVLQDSPGVWDIRVEDGRGNPVFYGFEVEDVGSEALLKAG
jgi:hypothetical protein